MKLDKIDRKILTHLQENCRVTVKELSEKLGLSATPIFERIKKMEQSGIIRKYVALLEPELLNLGLTTYIQISIKDQSKKGLDEFLQNITQFEEVLECYHMTGEFDFLIKVVTKNMASYNDFVLHKLSMVPHLGRVQSNFSLSVRKYTTAYTIDK